ncbi:serine/threonine-protein phosphatase 2A 56 kDa regulatory subunit epsilon isoform-like [Centruroides vittatus]|uniref:serine/threonine-protein phosphatase 2A 56 kDa regulatory subunit epsilon isoform-like n=1 Tax=Centruroides vittatus TaxID=120091 RepID=UPI00350EEE7D
MSYSSSAENTNFDQITSSLEIRLSGSDGDKETSYFRGSDSTTEISVSTQDINVISISKLPLLAKVSKSKREPLFISKLRQCSRIFQFLESETETKERQLKTQILIELYNFISSPTFDLSINCYKEIIIMFSNNVFQTLINYEMEYENSTEMKSSLLPAWPHLQLVYDFFLRFLEQKKLNTNFAIEVISKQFISQLIDLFCSFDHRERGKLMLILHKIYFLFNPLRLFIRNKIYGVFYRIIEKPINFNGISELLQVLSSVISGFLLPLKNEHKICLENYFLPLLKTKNLDQFHISWTKCIVSFMDKDSTLTEKVVNSLLESWPKHCNLVELVFLDILEKILNNIEFREFLKVRDKLLKQIVDCVNSSHYLITERTLNFWNNIIIIHLLESEHKLLMPILIPVLRKISTKHWNEHVVARANHILFRIKSENNILYDEFILN